MKKLLIGVKWIVLSACILSAGLCYSCGAGQTAPVSLEQTAVPETADAQESPGSVNPAGDAEHPEKASADAETEAVRFYVYVCGEVAHPSVYRLEAGSRICDAVDAAGGFTEAAEPRALNLAEPICDGMKILVPDTMQVPSDGVSEHAPDSGKVNLNTADKAALMTLPGIGEARAETIIRYREEHGNFSAIEDIMQVPGIKEAAFGKMKEDITI